MDLFWINKIYVLFFIIDYYDFEQILDIFNIKLLVIEKEFFLLILIEDEQGDFED